MLSFTGRVEVSSLARFFTASMAKDNWVISARFTTPKVVLLFEKPNKRAMMYITDGTFSTRVEVWLAPFLGAR